MADEFWLRFAASGKVEDYLKYKQHKFDSLLVKDENDENNNERLGYKGTDNRGE